MARFLRVLVLVVDAGKGDCHFINEKTLHERRPLEGKDFDGSEV